MSAFSGRGDLIPPYRLSGGARFSNWAKAQLEVDRFPMVVIDYDVWERLGVVRLLRLRTA
jgi:hypothetical protein